MEPFLDFLPFFAGLLLVALTYTGYKRIIRSNSTNKAPEPSGALPLIGHLHLLRGPNHVAKVLGKISDELGPIFSLRLGSQRMLVVSNMQMVKECFGTNDGNFANRPDVAFGRYMFYDNAGFGASNGPYWREIRKMVTVELFTKQALDKKNNIRTSEVKKSINELFLKNRGGKSSFVINEWIENVVFNINIRTVFGKKSSSREDMHVIESFKKALHLMGAFVVSDFFPNLEWMDIGGNIKAMRNVWKVIDSFIGKWLDEHAEKKKMGDGSEKETDFMDAMLSVVSKYDGMFGYGREIIIKSTAEVIMLAGSESTYETIIWALSLLLNNPHALKAAQKEIDMNVGRQKWVEESDINNLPYLHAIVKETLRLYPAGPLGATHESIADCNVAGYHIPKGTRLTVNIWKLHRDPQTWSEPNEFRPDRFLGEHSELNYQGQNFEYIPFSSGRRMCPGNFYALRIIYMTLARLLQGFDLSTPMGKPVDMTEGIGISLPKKTPLEVIITPRLSTDIY